MTILPISPKDTDWVKVVFASLNQQTNSENLQGFIAEEDGRKVGLITYVIAGGVCTIISLNSLTPGKGIGSMLYEKVEKVVKENGCKKITTKADEITKDFFQKQGFTVSQDGIEMEKSI